MAKRKGKEPGMGGVVAVGASLFAAGLAVTLAISNSDAPAPAAEEPSAAVENGAPSATTDESAQAPASTPVETAAVAPASIADAAAFAEIIAYQDSALTFEAIFPPGARNDIVLSELRKDAAALLENMKSDAQIAYSGEIAQGFTPNPWDVDIKWRETARSGEYASYIGDHYLYQGGAHGNVEFEALIANTQSGERINFSDMFLPPKTPSPAFVIALCDGLKTQKNDRIGEASVYGEPIVCNGAGANISAEMPIVTLAKSTEAGKFGGAQIYYPPYAVGPYAEGSYVVTVAQGVFAGDLRPPYNDLFAGEPVLAQN